MGLRESSTVYNHRFARFSFRRINENFFFSIRKKKLRQFEDRISFYDTNFSRTNNFRIDRIQDEGERKKPSFNTHFDDNGYWTWINLDFNSYGGRFFQFYRLRLYLEQKPWIKIFFSNYPSRWNRDRFPGEFSSSLTERRIY